MVFSPTDSNIAALVRRGSIHTVKQDSFGGKTWAGQYKLTGSGIGSVAACTFNSNGRTIVVSNRKDLQEYNTTTTSTPLREFASLYDITSVVFCPTWILPGWFVVDDHEGVLIVDCNALPRSLSRLIPVYPAKVSACAWSQDRKWIATGNGIGDIFLECNCSD